MIDNNVFFKDKKFINAWTFYHDNERFDAKAGDVGFLYNDPENNYERTIEVINGSDYFYFYILKSNENIKKLNRIYPEERIQVGNKYIRVYYRLKKYRSPGYMSLIKELEDAGVETFEADINSARRLCLDYDVQIEDWKNIKVLYFDIETDDSIGSIEIGRDRILSFAGLDKDGNEFYDTDRDEYELLKRLIKLTDQYDMLVGWYSRGFDLPYVLERVKVINKLNRNDKSKEQIDTTLFYNTLHEDMMMRVLKTYSQDAEARQEISSYSLESISQYFLGEGKVEHEEKIIELFNNNPEKLKKYNLKDAKLLFKINEKLRTIPLMIKECAWTGTFLNRFYIGELLDNYILREATYQNFHLRSRPGWGENDENQKIRGGYVMEPKTGMYDSVRTLDFKSMYPSIIVGWNIGQESLVEGRVSRTAEEDFLKWIEERKLDDVPYKEWHEFLAKENKKLNPDNLYYQTANNQFFKRDKQSIIAGLVKRLLQERKSYKKQQIDSVYNSIEYKNAQASQEAVKEMSNSMYGINADKQARYFDPKIAEAITMTGQFLNRMSMSILEEMGYLVIYGDTDSIFIVVESDEEMEIVINSLNEALSQRLVDNYQFLENIVFIEYEKKFSKFIMLDKKRYAGYLVEIDGKPVNSILSKGTENVRKSTINFTKKKVNECLDLLLKQHKSKTFMKEWIRDLKEYVLDGDIPSSDLAITMKLSKPISSYKSKPPHVRLAEKLIENNEILETYEGKSVWGQKIEYIVIDSKNKNESILLRDFNGVWDRKYYWDVQVYAPLMRILKAVWPESNWEEHNIILFEKMQKKIEKEKEKEQKKKEKEQKKKEKAQKKKEKGAIKKEKGFKKGKQLKLAL